jgi:hypothetical protein
MREGRAKVKDAAKRLDAWLEEIGAVESYGRSGWWG